MFFFLLQSVKSLFKSSDPYYIVGYSFGALVAIQLASLLEKAGYRGQLTLIDGAPHFLKKLTLAHLGENFKDEDLYTLLLSSIVNQIFPEESTESASEMFMKLETLNDKMIKFMEYVNKQNLYSREYSEAIVVAMFNRINMAVNYNLTEIEQIKSPITLIRPSEVSMQDIAEDYELSKITKGTVTLKFVEGNHTTMLDNPTLPQYINDFDPALQDDKLFEEYIKDVKPVSVV